MSQFVQVQCNFYKDRINHRIRFGKPDKIVVIDRHRKLALFKPNSILGYIRWKANKYGTIDWRLYVVKTSEDGVLSSVPGIEPAVEVLVSVVGTVAMKRALTVVDTIEKEALNGIETVPASYWMMVSNALYLRQKPRRLPRNHRKIIEIEEHDYAL